MERSVLAWLVPFAAAFALYLCFAARVSGTEAAIGAVIAAFAATAAYVVRPAEGARFTRHPRWVAQAWRLPRYAITGTKEILSVLFHHLFAGREARSLLLEVPYASDRDEADAATRRALLAAYTTITPNFIVLGFDEERRRMIFHQVERSAIPEMTKRLGAEA